MGLALVVLRLGKHESLRKLAWLCCCGNNLIKIGCFFDDFGKCSALGQCTWELAIVVQHAANAHQAH